MGKILTVANQKGGVAKTTTSVNLSAALASLEKRVLLVDMDPQGNATSGLGFDKHQKMRCIYDVLINEYPLAKVVLQTEVEGFFVAPATIQLAGAEIELVTAISREKKFKEALDPIKDEYDYVVVDCPPSLGLLTLNALTAADGALIPVQCEYYALEGLSQLIDTVQLAKKHLNPSLDIFGVVLTMYDARTNLSEQVVGEVRRFFKEKTFDTVISRNVRLSEAPSYGKPIALYDPKSKGADQYMALAREVIARG
ncbi:MAG: AAA family ATPase [Peptococcaceae bacterium]|jgi:chromosome partitioning protein|nr:AAA family ATPase [Peptococcaceae bacterium]